MPTYDKIEPITLDSLMRLRQHVPFQISMIGTSEVAVSRTLLAKTGIDSNADLLLWVDSDMAFTPEQFFAMHQALEKQPEMGLLSALAVRRDGSNSFCVNWELGKKQWYPPERLNKRVLKHIEADEISPVDVTGFAFTLMYTEVLEKLKKPWFQPKWLENPEDVGNYQFFGEDSSFLKKMKNAGYRPSVHWTRTILRTRAKIKAGDSELTVSDLWTDNEADYALTAAYRDIMMQLLKKRHPSTRHLHYENSNATNPVATIQWASETIEDVLAVHISDDGANLVSSPSSSVSILKPRDWTFLSQYLYTSEYNVEEPEYYSLVNNGADLEIWVAALPESAGTNSVRILVHGIPDWPETDSAVPPVPSKYDQLLINQAAIHMRSDKQLELNDLAGVTSPLWEELRKQQGEPKPEQSYKIPVVGGVSNRLKSRATVGGRIRRT
jgi:hypothetical protein